MKNFYKYFYFAALSNVLLQPLISETKEVAIAKNSQNLTVHRRAYNPQDRPNLTAQNPLKGLSKFIVFPMCPAGTKELSEKVFDLVEKELKQVGQVNKSKILIQTNQGEEIDLSVFAIGVTLIYEIENLKDLSGADLGIVRASLNLDTAVEIKKTQETCSPYIWSSNCFLKGSTTKDLENLVEQSLNALLKQFMASYSSANSNKPVFELQGAE